MPTAGTMSSTMHRLRGPFPPSYPQATRVKDDKMKGAGEPLENTELDAASIGNGDHTHRKLKPRHIQLIGILSTRQQLKASLQSTVYNIITLS